MLCGCIVELSCLISRADDLHKSTSAFTSSAVNSANVAGFLGAVLTK